MKINENKPNAIVPANLSLAQIKQAFNPIAYDIKRFDDDFALYIISQITEIMAGDKRYYEVLEDHFTRICSDALQDMNPEYRLYLDYLITAGVIESDWKYIQKKVDSNGRGKCYGFRFVAEFQHTDLVEVPYSQGFTERLEWKKKKYINSLYLNYGQLTKWYFPNCVLRIDREIAETYLEFKLRAQLANPDLISTKRNKRGKLVAKDPHRQYQMALCNIHKIASGNWYCTVDKRVHRMHTPLTNLTKMVRNFLFVERNGQRQKLKTFDVKNCQPYIASILLDVYNVKLIRKISKECGYEPAQAILEHLCHLYETEDFVAPDIALYKSLVSNIDGNSMDLYTYMYNESQKQGYDYKDRDEIKVAMLGVLFGDVAYDSDIKTLFADLFPGVNEVFKIIKDKNKADLPCLLQSMESYFLLMKVTKAIAKKYPNAPLWSIHDSITTTEEYADRVYQIIVEELTNLVGLPPKVNRESWEEGNVDWYKYE